MSGVHRPGKELLAPSVERREVFGESYERGATSYRSYNRL